MRYSQVQGVLWLLTRYLLEDDSWRAQEPFRRVHLRLVDESKELRGKRTGLAPTLEVVVDGLQVSRLYYCWQECKLLDSRVLSALRKYSCNCETTKLCC